MGAFAADEELAEILIAKDGAKTIACLFKDFFAVSDKKKGWRWTGRCIDLGFCYEASVVESSYDSLTCASSSNHKVAIFTDRASGGEGVENTFLEWVRS